MSAFPALTFIIPVRDPKGVANWPAIRELLATTLRSISAQTTPGWKAIVIANRGTDLPPLPAGVEPLFIDAPYRPLTPEAVDQAAFYRDVRADKGRRVLAGLMHARPAGHIMVVDYDDLVSNRLSALVQRLPDANGWYFDTGYFFWGGRFLYARRHEFYEVCGTSHIVHARFLRLPDRAEDADEQFVQEMLGSHKFVKKRLAEWGSPLAALPFAGAVYRMGHAGSVSASMGMWRHLFSKRDLSRKPHRAFGRVTRLRPLTQRFKHEFFGGAGA